MLDSLTDLIHLHTDLQFVILCKLSGLRLPVPDLNVTGKTASLIEDLAKNTKDLALSLLCQRGVLQNHHQHILLRILKHCPSHSQIDHMTVLLDLFQHALQIYIQQILHGVLGGQLIFLMDLDLNRRLGKELSLDLLLHTPDIFLLNQTFAEKINVQHISVLGGGNSLHHSLLHHIPQCILQL